MPMKKPAPRLVWKRETWKPYKVLVRRDQRGRFKHWARIRPKPPTKAPRRHFAKITYEEHKAPGEAGAYERYRELYREPKGKALSVYGKVLIKKGRVKMIESRRWELVKGSLTGDEWRHAVGHARQHPPRPRASFRKSLAENIPDNYEEEGEWLDTPTIESK